MHNRSTQHKSQNERIGVTTMKNGNGNGAEKNGPRIKNEANGTRYGSKFT